MGDSLSAMYDNYDDYKHLCKVLGLAYLPLRGYIGEGDKTFYDDQERILKLYNCANQYQLYAIMNCSEDALKKK